MPLTLRLMESADADAVSALLPDLGYEATPAQVARRLAGLRAWPDQEAFVADIDGAVVGLCHVQGVRMLISDGYAEIQALVVSAACQGQGIGKRLIEETKKAAGGEVTTTLLLAAPGAVTFYQGIKMPQLDNCFAYRRSK